MERERKHWTMVVDVQLPRNDSLFARVIVEHDGMDVRGTDTGTIWSTSVEAIHFVQGGEIQMRPHRDDHIDEGEEAELLGEARRRVNAIASVGDVMRLTRLTRMDGGSQGRAAGRWESDYDREDADMYDGACAMIITRAAALLVMCTDIDHPHVEGYEGTVLALVKHQLDCWYFG